MNFYLGSENLGRLGEIVFEIDNINYCVGDMFVNLKYMEDERIIKMYPLVKEESGVSFIMGFRGSTNNNNKIFENFKRVISVKDLSPNAMKDIINVYEKNLRLEDKKEHVFDIDVNSKKNLSEHVVMEKAVVKLSVTQNFEGNILKSTIETNNEFYPKVMSYHNKNDNMSKEYNKTVGILKAYTKLNDLVKL